MDIYINFSVTPKQAVTALYGEAKRIQDSRKAH